MEANLSDIASEEQLKAYGIPRPLYLDKGEGASLINYLDLISNRNKKLIPEAVVEYQSRPILYLINHTRLSDSPKKHRIELLNIKRILANRGEIAYFAVLQPGQLTVFPINLEKDLGGKIEISKSKQSSQTFFQSLVLGTSKVIKQSNPDYIYDRIFSLLQKTSNHLISMPCNLPKSDVLSLVGRALFFRFLKDRNIIIESDLEDICPGAKHLESCFTNAKNATSTSAWLDATFNGDLLPLPFNGNQKYFNSIDKQTKGAVFLHLSAIVFGAEPAGSNYQLHLWKDFDFSHIPVGLLSQVYESFSSKWDPHSKSTSIHYTPRSIAEYLIDESFASISNPSRARVLDPSVGAGIFLVIAFKKIVAETWKKEGVRPNSKKIQEILYNQLSGFDINESALKLASLSLYLTAIELDANPRPAEKLRFPRPLREKVLFYVRKSSDPVEGPVLGSLEFESNELQKNKYDLVVGNPPWTQLGKEHSDLADQYTKIIRRIALNRGLENIATNYSNPGKNPDLPFIWKAMEWSKPGGTIAFTLPSRILFKQSPVGRKAREALFQALNVTGVLNYSCLRKTKIWPKMNHPFCLFFAKNTLPKKESEFYFVSPRLEIALNSRGRARIDYASAEPIQSSKLIKEPWLLKTLAVGSPLDVTVLRKLKKKTKTTIKDYWGEKNLKHSRGYEINEKEKLVSALEVKDFPDLNNDTAEHISFFLDTQQLPLFNSDHQRRRKDIKIYQPPLLLLRKSPREDTKDGKNLLCLKKVAYHEIFYGYSGCGHPNAEELIRYIYLISYSSLFKYYILTTSPKFAVDRPVFHKIDFDNFPFIPLEEIQKQDRNNIWDLSNKLAHGDSKPFDKIDEFICRIYGLDSDDMEIISDTIDVGLPFKKSRERAEAPPSRQQVEICRNNIKNQLNPFFKIVNQELQVKPIVIDSDQFGQPWRFLELSNQVDGDQKYFSQFLNDLMEIANDQGASQIIIKTPQGVLIGLLNQYRYWTKSRARLIGLNILRNHMDSFELPGNRK